jgi:hypothetical protein
MRIGRRSLLQTAGAMVAVASVHSPLFAESGRLLTLVDPSLRQRAGAMPIQPDLVRQWRDGLRSDIALARGAVAYVRWDKALLLAGLARECGMTARHRRLDRSCFEVRIELRPIDKEPARNPTE